MEQKINGGVVVGYVETPVAVEEEEVKPKGRPKKK